MLGPVLNASGDLLGFGAGVAMVIAALTYFLSTAKREKGKLEK